MRPNLALKRMRLTDRYGKLTGMGSMTGIGWLVGINSAKSTSQCATRSITV